VRTLVFKLTVRPGTAGTRLSLAATASYLDVESGEMRTVRNSEAVLTYGTAAEVAAETPDAGVVEEAALLEVALAREEALRYDAAGQHAQSAATLANAAAYLGVVAPASPVARAEAQALQAESSEAEHGLDALKRKAIHYAQSARRQSRKQ
jgi:hypothetical protein